MNIRDEVARAFVKRCRLADPKFAEVLADEALRVIADEVETYEPEIVGDEDEVSTDVVDRIVDDLRRAIGGST